MRAACTRRACLSGCHQETLRRTFSAPPPAFLGALLCVAPHLHLTGTSPGLPFWRSSPGGGALRRTFSAPPRCISWRAPLFGGPTYVRPALTGLAFLALIGGCSGTHSALPRPAFLGALLLFGGPRMRAASLTACRALLGGGLRRTFKRSPALHLLAHLCLAAPACVPPISCFFRQLREGVVRSAFSCAAKLHSLLLSVTARAGGHH